MCSALKFPRSTYYKALINEPSNKKKQYQEFKEKVMTCYLRNKKIYGAVKITRTLNDTGTPCSIKRVQRHMQALEIRSVVVRKYKYKANQGKVAEGKKID
ncbi:MAG: IS3 family transposase [Eubacteriaceae bacterium]